MRLKGFEVHGSTVIRIGKSGFSWCRLPVFGAGIYNCGLQNQPLNREPLNLFNLFTIYGARVKSLSVREPCIFDKRSAVFGSLVVALLSALFLSCIVPADPPDTSLHFFKCGSGDTISPFGSLRIAFSEPSADTVVPRFSFSPPNYAYVVVMNKTRDTATVSWTEPLAGAGRFVMRLDSYTTAEMKQTSSKDSVVFLTWALEREPNAAPATADTLETVRWGTVAMVDDTDWYVITEGSVPALVLNSTGSQTTFSVMSNGRLVDSSRIFRASDTLRIAETAEHPLYIAVFAAFRSVGGFYELRRIVSGK
jgi:hypothetical protein